MAELKKLIDEYENKRPEVVFEWQDALTEAEGWVVINSLRGGAAGGGTRMRKGLDKREVESLAKTMEVKFTVCGPPIGGAKSGINFDPSDPRKEGVLKRWYKAVYPLLKNYYGTGGDMNVDKIKEVMPITRSYGIIHPQEGIVNGHLSEYTPEEKIQALMRLEQGASLIVTEGKFTPSIAKGYTVSDLITGWGVAEAVRHYYGIWGGMMNHKRAIIQGWGNVAAAAAYYLAKNGVNIIGIIDINGGIIKEEGLSLEEVTDLMNNRDGNKLKSDDMISFAEANKRIWKLGAEIFIPGAASRLVTKHQVDSLIEGGIEVVSCGANVPFADSEIFMGPIYSYADQHMAIIPDFIANCGMARVFAYLMKKQAEVKDVDILMDVSEAIERAMIKVHQFNQKHIGISSKALELSLMTITKPD